MEYFSKGIRLFHQNYIPAKIYFWLLPLIINSQQCMLFIWGVLFKWGCTYTSYDLDIIRASLYHLSRSQFAIHKNYNPWYLRNMLGSISHISAQIDFRGNSKTFYLFNFVSSIFVSLVFSCNICFKRRLSCSSWRLSWMTFVENSRADSKSFNSFSRSSSSCI